MGMTVTARPNQVNGVIKSSWVAARNPVLYKIRRVDHSFTGVTNSGGFAEFVISDTVGNVTSFFPIGDDVYVDGNGDYEGLTGAITGVSFSSSHTRVLTDIAYSTNVVGIINNISKRTDWKVLIELFDGDSNESLTNDIADDCSPSSSDWVATFDCSDLLMNFMVPDWELPDSGNESESVSSKKFYIKYQEYYDGALISSPTDDVANQFFAVNASMQIGSSDGNNLLDYVPEATDYPVANSVLWLTKFQISDTLKKLVLWRGWPFTLSFIYPPALSPGMRSIQYDASGDEVQTDLDTFVGGAGSVNRIALPDIHADAKRIEVYLVNNAVGDFVVLTIPGDGIAFNVGWENVAPGAAQWVLGATQASTNMNFGAPYKLAITPTDVVDTRDGFIKVVFDMTIPAGEQLDVVLWARSGSNDWVGLGQAVNQLGTGSPESITIQSVLITEATPYTQYALGFTSDTGAIASVVIDNFVISFSKSILTSTLDIEVRDACRNPLYLFWKNSLGGDAFWMFDVDQELSYEVISESKFPKYGLSVLGLHMVQWKALQDLISPNTVYRTNLIELNSDVNKTHKQVNHQVYVVDEDGNKTGVIVRPSRNTTRTRQSRHVFEVEIEYPHLL
jgi:hypothetical protein